MTTPYFIGIGGTGARVAESLVHLCAAGLGPRRLKLFLIDPDRANGNLEKTRELITSYQETRERVRESVPADMPLFRTELSTPSQLVWHIFGETQTRLRDFIGLNNLKQNEPELHDLAQLLFTDGELQEELDQGFRGHPAIGAVVMTKAERDTVDPWKTFWDDVAAADQPGAIRAFLAGSVFGGTGAAGIPTFGAPEMIRNRASIQDGAQSKVALGALLVLPYFRVTDDGTGDEDRLFVTSNDFPIATKAALEFYAEKQLAFDNVYLLGDPGSKVVGEFSPGAGKQQNRPHFAELVGALSALDFFGKPAVEPDRYYVAARRTSDVTWADLPVVTEGDVNAELTRLKHRMVTMAVFAYAMVDFGLPTLEADPDGVHYTWHDEHFKPKKRDQDASRDVRAAGPMRTVRLTSEYAQKWLRWLAAMDEGPDGDLHLLDGARLFQGGELVHHEADLGAVGSLLREGGKGNDFNHFRNLLDAAPAPSDTLHAAGRYVSLFYSVARQFAEDTYAITPPAEGR